MKKGKDHSRKLILFTSDFPFGTGETFLETEIQYLCKGFDEVRIISSSPSKEQTRDVPDNCRVERLNLQVTPSQKLFSLIYLIHPLFWKELQIIRKTYKFRISKGIVFTMLVSLARSKRVEKKVAQIVKVKRQEDHLYFYSYWCDDAALGLALAQRQIPKIKTFCRIHRWDVYFEESAVCYLPYRHFITNQLHVIFSISQDGIDYAKRVWKTGREEKFHLSRLGIQHDYPLIKVERDYLLLVSCSNLIPVKRVHLIAEALKEIRDIQLKWVHIGDGPERNRIEELIKQMPSNISVELKGRIPNKEIYSYYDEVRPDLFINVSASEGVPVSIMEAMSFGIPVIATDVGGNGEIVNEGNGVLLTSEPNSIGITENIISMVEQEENFDSLKQAAINSWEQNFNAEKNYNSFVQNIMNL